MKKESLAAARAAYEIEAECLRNMIDYFDEEAFAKAVALLKDCIIYEKPGEMWWA